MASRNTSTVAEVTTANLADGRVTSAVVDTLLDTGPSQGRVTSTVAEALLVTGPPEGRVTSTVLEALISIAFHAPGWVCVIQ